jgi:MFS family permease
VRDRNAIAYFALGACATWNAGNIGPLTAPLVAEFDISLTTVGLISGTAFFAGITAATLAGAEIARRIPLATGLRASCVFLAAGNVICAASPILAVLIGGRFIVGIGLGLTLLFGGAFARAEGGLRALGIYGAGITLGVALALGIGGLLEEAGVDWRVSLLLAALIGLIPLPLIPSEAPQVAPTNEPSAGPFEEAARSLPFWRLQLLSITVLGIPLVLSVWLISYLGVEEGVAVGAAGVISFGLFGLSAATRYLGGVMSARGASPSAVALFGCFVGALGIAVVAVGDGVPAAIAGVVLIGASISFPASLVYDEGENVLPGRPLGGLGLIVTGASAFPIVAIPLVGAAIGSGDGEAALLALAALAALSGLANAKPAAPSGLPG